MPAALWWGPFTSEVTQQFIAAAQSGTSADALVDSLAAKWNELKAEYE